MSRLTATKLPFSSVAPSAALSLAANSGVRSTLTTPETPKRVKSERRPWLPQMTLSRTVAPGSIILRGQSLTLAWMAAPSPMTQLSPTIAPSKIATLDLMVHWRLTTTPRSSHDSPT